MIILTTRQAERVRGISPTNGRAALAPIPLRDGTFIIGEEVLDDPAHADVSSLLMTLPKREISDAERYGTDEARLEADSSEIRSKNIPSYEQIGVRTEATRR